MFRCFFGGAIVVFALAVIVDTRSQAGKDPLKIKDVMTTLVLTTTPETPLADAARMLIEHKIGCLPVLDGERLAGILTEGDFVAF